MRDQEIDLACLAEEGEGLRPMRLRYGVTEPVNQGEALVTRV